MNWQFSVTFAFPLLVCECVCRYTRVSMYGQACVHVSVYMHMYLCASGHVCVCVCVHMCVFVFLHLCVYMGVYVCMSISMCAPVCFVCVCICACVCVCMGIMCANEYM